jgi:Flp pilus assembly protein TadB
MESIFLAGSINLLKRFIGVCVLAFLVSFVFDTSSYFTFPGLLVRLLGLIFVVSSIVVIARYESRKKLEREAGITA